MSGQVLEIWWWKASPISKRISDIVAVVRKESVGNGKDVGEFRRILKSGSYYRNAVGSLHSTPVENCGYVWSRKMVSPFHAYSLFPSRNQGETTLV